MKHIDDWLDDETTGPKDVKEWLNNFRSSMFHKDNNYLLDKNLYCKYKDGEWYKCIGFTGSKGAIIIDEDLCYQLPENKKTSGLWLINADGLLTTGHDIDDCFDWEVIKNNGDLYVHA